MRISLLVFIGGLRYRKLGADYLLNGGSIYIVLDVMGYFQDIPVAPNTGMPPTIVQRFLTLICIERKIYIVVEVPSIIS